MAYEIEPRKVAGVVIEANQALVNKGFNQGEVLLGLSELIGRMIVEAAENKIQADEMVKVVNQHMELTINIGSQATEKSIIERV